MNEKFRYIDSSHTDPQYNLALEQYLFDNLDRNYSYCMLWQNHNSVIVGKHQNTLAEINVKYVNEHKINVVRRLSGGGAVYHDLGNVNFTFITNTTENCNIDFTPFCELIKKALVSFEVPVLITGRNDMTIEGKKISGNAQYIKKNRIMHHGTLLYDSNIDMLSNVLNVQEDKIESKGIKSVKSRVTNIRPFMKTDMPVEIFKKTLKDYLISSCGMEEYTLDSEQITGVERLKEQRYLQWSWNYGASPPYNIRKERRIENCGKIEILVDVGNDGIIKNIDFFGDFFSECETAELGYMLAGKKFEYNELKNLLINVDISRHFHNLDSEKFLSILFE